MRVEADGSRTTIEQLGRSNAEFQRRLSTGYERLKPGPGKSAELVRASQRERIHRAMIELAAEKGFEHVTVRAVTGTAGVSSRTFYRHFADREQCLASAVDAIGRRSLLRAARRKPDDATWKGRVSASLQSLLDDFAAQPGATRVLLVEAFAAGRPGRTRATELTANLERLLGQLLAAAPMASVPPRHLVVGIAAGVVRVATMTSLTGRAGELSGLVGHLSEWVFSVYDERAVRLFTEAQRGPSREWRNECFRPPAELRAISGYEEYERILSAASRLAAKNGFAALTVSKIRREAGVSRRTFDACFDDVVDCFLAAIEAHARTAARRADAWTSEGRGRDRNRTTLALCAIVARSPVPARLVLAEILAPGRAGLLLRERLISAAAEWMRMAPTGLTTADSGSVAAEASAAAVWRIAEREIAAGRATRLPEVARFLAAGLPAAPVAGAGAG